MKHEEGHFQSIRNVSIYWQTWLPESEPRAVLLIVHGYDDHSGRYMNIVNHFVPKGFAVCGLDHIGHGKSEGKRWYVQKFEDYTEILQFFLRMVQNMQAEKPVFLIGFSLGALITSVYLLDNQEELVGSVLVAPGVKVPENISAFTIFMGKILSAILPKAGLLVFEDEDISKDQSVVEAYKLDPLVYRGKMTARLSAEILKAMIRLNKEGTRITLPILIVQGAADRLVDPEGAQMLLDLIQSKDKQIKLYEGLYHEVFNEPEREIVFADVEDWLNRRI
jgi:alpha-beta hydrolase superfamily lysophospholipase